MRGGGAGPAVSCCSELLSESRMVAGLMGAGGRGTVIPGFRLGLASGGPDSPPVVGGEREEAGGGGGVAGRLVLAWGRAVGVGLLLRLGRGEGSWLGGREEERLSFPWVETEPPPLAPLASFFRLLRLHISWQSWECGRLRTQTQSLTPSHHHCTHITTAHTSPLHTYHH